MKATKTDAKLRIQVDGGDTGEGGGACDDGAANGGGEERGGDDGAANGGGGGAERLVCSAFSGKSLGDTGGSGKGVSDTGSCGDGGDGTKGSDTTMGAETPSAMSTMLSISGPPILLVCTHGFFFQSHAGTHSLFPSRRQRGAGHWAALRAHRCSAHPASLVDCNEFST